MIDECRPSLVHGKRYEIRIDDCCVEAEIEGVFLHREYDEFEPDVIWCYHFDFGLIRPGWGRWSTRKVGTEEWEYGCE